MKLDDFDFDLPARLIATRPVRPRSAARLLAVTGDEMRDLHVRDLPALLRDGDLLVLNDTRVIRRGCTAPGPARPGRGKV